MGMNGWNLALNIVGVAGFLLALLLAYVEWHRYKYPLRMVVREAKYIGSSEDTHLVFLSLAFVNPSSVGKTVFRILGVSLTKGDFVPCPYQYQKDDESLVFQLPNSDKVATLQKNELLWLPLDIPPNQSETKWYPALMHKKMGLEEKRPEIHIRLLAQDVLEKQLALIDQTIELKTYQIF